MEVEKSLWKEKVRKDASIKSLGSCYRVEKGICAKEGESIFTVKRRKGESTGIYRRPAEKRVHLTLQITLNFTSTFCSKKGWKIENSAGLSTHKPVDNKK